MFGCLPLDGPHREGGLLAGLGTYLPLSRTTLTQQCCVLRYHAGSSRIDVEVLSVLACGCSCFRGVELGLSFENRPRGRLWSRYFVAILFMFLSAATTTQPKDLSSSSVLCV